MTEIQKEQRSKKNRDAVDAELSDEEKSRIKERSKVDGRVARGADSVEFDDLDAISETKAGDKKESKIK